MEGQDKKMGVKSLVLGIMGLFSLLGFIFVPTSLYPWHFLPLLVSVVCSLLAVKLGLTSYFNRDENSYGLTGLALGGIILSLGLLLIVIILLLASVT